MDTTREMLSHSHWTSAFYKQRMTSAEWRNILLKEKDVIVFQGRCVPLKGKKIGPGVYEVEKDFPPSEETEHKRLLELFGK